MTSTRQPGIHRVKPCLKNKQRRKGKGREERKDYEVYCTRYSVHDWKKHLTKSSLRKEVWLWVTTQRDTVHSCCSPHVHSQEARTEMNTVVLLTFSFSWPIGWCHPYSGWIFPPQLNLICSEVCLLHRVPNPIELTSLTITLGVWPFTSPFQSWNPEDQKFKKVSTT